MTHEPDLNRYCPHCSADCERPDGFPAMHDPDCRDASGFGTAEGHEICVRCRQRLDVGELYVPRLDDHLNGGQATFAPTCLGCAALPAAA